MHKAFIAVSALLIGLCPALALADDLSGVPVLQNDTTVIVPVSGAVAYDTLAQHSPLDQGSGWQEYIDVSSPQKLVELQKQYGGMLFASTGNLCIERYTEFSGDYDVDRIKYGLVGAVIGKTGVNFSARIDLNKIIAPLVEGNKKVGKYRRGCILTEDNNVVIQFYQGAVPTN